MTDNIIWVQENPYLALEHPHRLSRNFCKKIFWSILLYTEECSTAAISMWDLASIDFILNMRTHKGEFSKPMNPSDIFCTDKLQTESKKKYWRDEASQLTQTKKKWAFASTAQWAIWTKKGMCTHKLESSKNVVVWKIIKITLFLFK